MLRLRLAFVSNNIELKFFKDTGMAGHMNGTKTITVISNSCLSHSFANWMEFISQTWKKWARKGSSYCQDDCIVQETNKFWRAMDEIAKNCCWQLDDEDRTMALKPPKNEKLDWAKPFCERNQRKCFIIYTINSHFNHAKLLLAYCANF